jgi:hypothetical protein
MFRIRWGKLLLSLFRPAVSTIHNRPLPRRRGRPRVEHLEDRLAPAVMATFDPVKHLLSVTLNAMGDTAKLAVVTNNVEVRDGNNTLVLSQAANAITDISATGSNDPNQTVAINSDFLFSGLSGLTIDKVKAIDVNGNVTTANDQTYNDPVLLGANVKLSGKDVTFASSLDGAQDLEVSSTATTTFGGEVGAMTSLKSLLVDPGTATAINTDLVSTTGSQTFNSAVTLGFAPATGFDASKVTFGSTVGGGGNSLSVKGNAEFDNTISNVKSLQVTGTTAIDTTSVSTTGDQTYQNDVTLGAANTTLQSTTGTLSFATKVAAGTDNLTLTADTISLPAPANTVSGTGKIAFSPVSTGDTIGIAGAAGTLQIPQATLDALKDGFSQITIGRSDGTGKVTTNAVSFKDPVVIESPGMGGSIAVNGKITGTDDASITLTGSGATTTLNADIVTSGTAITINDSVLLGTPATITLDTTNGNGTPTGAGITITGTVDDDVANTTTLVLQSGTGGDIDLKKAVGATAAPIGVTVNSAQNVTFEGTIRTAGDVTQTTGTKTTTFNGTSGTGIGGKLTVTTDTIVLNTATLTTVGAVALTANGDVTLNAGLNAGASTVTIQANQGGTGTNGFVQNAGGDITTTNATANAVSISVASGVTGAALRNITVGSGGTISVNANNGSITQAAGTLGAGTGTVTLTTGGVASGIGTLAANINTSAATINATAGSGGAFITNASGGNFTVTATGAGNIQLVSTAGTLTIAGKTATPSGDITLCSQAGGIAVQANLSAAAGTVRLASAAGVSQTAAGEIDATNLGIRAAGDVALDTIASKVTSTLAVADTGAGNVVRFLGDSSFSTGTVLGVAGTCFTTDTTGVVSKDGDVTLCTNGASLALGAKVDAGKGTARLMSTGAISQTAAITAANLAVSAAGDVTLDQATNSVSGIFAADDTTLAKVVRFLDGSNFSTDAIAGVAGTCFTATITGVTAFNGDVTLCSKGTSLALDATVDAGTGTVRLMSNGGISQNSSGVIKGSALAVSAAGDVTLDQATNDVTTTFAAKDTGSGNVVRFHDGVAFATGTVAGVAGTCFTATITGVTSTKGDITLCNDAGTLAINAAVDAGTGTAMLASGAGISQTAAITAANLGVRASGDVALDQATNEISGSFAAADAGLNNVVRFLDGVGFSTGTINGVAGTCFPTTTAGVVSDKGDITLCAMTGGIAIGTQVNAGTGDVRLSAAGDITQSAAITATNLGVRTTGAVRLTGLANQVTGVFAANATAVAFQDGPTFSLGTVAGVAGTCFTTDTTGVGGDDVTLCSGGDLNVTAVITSTGTVRLAAGTAVTQTNAVTASITAVNLGITAGGNVTLDGASTKNDISGAFAAQVTGGTSFVRFRNTDTAGFSVGQVIAVDCFGGTTGVVTAGGDVALGDAQAGAILTINNVINAGAGTVRLAFGNAVTQANSSAASITAGDLGITSGGNVTLDGASTTNNVSGKVAIAGTGNGDFIHFRDTNSAGFTVGSVGALSVFGGATGVTTTGNGDIALTDSVSTADLTINNGVNAGTGAVRLALGRAISQDNAATASITAGDLGLTAGGNVALDGASTTNVVTGNFAANDSGAGAFIHFLDTSSGGFTIDAVAALSGFGGATGVTTAGSGDIALCDAQAAADLTINAVVTGGPVRLGFGRAVTQTNAATASITATDLGITASGNVTLDGAATTNNVTGNFAANTSSSGAFVHFSDIASGGFSVGAVAAASCFGGATGVTTVGAGDIILTDAFGGLTINDVVTAGSGGDVRLGFGGAIAQANLSTASITAVNLGITAAGNVSLDGTNTANVASTFAATNSGAGSFVHVADTAAGTVTVGTVTASNQFSGATGVTTIGTGDIILTDTAASLQINNVLTSPNADVRLGFGGAVNQSNLLAASITAVNLGINAAGDVTLDGALTSNNVTGNFAASNTGVKSFVHFTDHSTSLTVGDVGPRNRFTDAPGIVTNDGEVVLRGDGDFTVVDMKTVSVIKTNSAAGAGNVTVTAGAAVTNAAVKIDVEGQIESPGATVTINGATGTGAHLVNNFSIRPGSGKSTTIHVVGNGALLPTCPDTLALVNTIEAKASLTQFFADPNPCNGKFEFNNDPDQTIDPARAIIYVNIGHLQSEAAQVTTVQTSNHDFEFIATATIGGSTLVGVAKITPFAVNPFILSAAFANPTGSIVSPSAPRVALADVDGDGFQDIILANGPNGPPVITVISGRDLVGKSSITAVVNGRTIIDPVNLVGHTPGHNQGQFFAFDPNFLGGVNVAAGHLGVRGTGPVSIVASLDVGGGPTVRVFTFDPSQPSAFKQTAAFAPYDLGFKGGVRLAVGDVPGRMPIIVTAPGPGAALPVKIFSVTQNTSTLAVTVTDTKQALFPYGAHYSDGIVVAVGNLYQNTATSKATNDIMTGPEAGDPVIDIFRSETTTYTSTPQISFLAFRNGKGTQLATNKSVTFNANSGVFGVSAVGFGSFSQGLNSPAPRDIIVGTGTGNNAFQMVGPPPDMGLTTPFIKPTKGRRPMFAKMRSARGVNIAGQRG